MTTAYWRCKERLYSNCRLELGLESSFKSKSAMTNTRATELQSFETRAFIASKESIRGKHPRKPTKELQRNRETEVQKSRTLRPSAGVGE